MGETPLFQAVELNQYNAIKILLEKNADPNIPSNDGRIPLHNAIMKKDINLISLLLNCKSNPNAKTKLYGQTPLHLAMKNSINLSIIELFLKFGGDLTIKDKYDKTPIDYIQLQETKDYILNTIKEKEEAKESIKSNKTYKTPEKIIIKNNDANADNFNAFLNSNTNNYADESNFGILDSEKDFSKKKQKQINYQNFLDISPIEYNKDISNFKSDLKKEKENDNDNDKDNDKEREREKIELNLNLFSNKENKQSKIADSSANGFLSGLKNNLLFDFENENNYDENDNDNKNKDFKINLFHYDNKFDGKSNLYLKKNSNSNSKKNFLFDEVLIKSKDFECDNKKKEIQMQIQTINTNKSNKFSLSDLQLKEIIYNNNNDNDNDNYYNKNKNFESLLTIDNKENNKTFKGENLNFKFNPLNIKDSEITHNNNSSKNLEFNMFINNNNINNDYATFNNNDYNEYIDYNDYNKLELQHLNSEKEENNTFNNNKNNYNINEINLNLNDFNSNNNINNNHNNNPEKIKTPKSVLSQMTFFKNQNYTNSKSESMIKANLMTSEKDKFNTNPYPDKDPNSLDNNSNNILGKLKKLNSNSMNNTISPNKQDQKNLKNDKEYIFEGENWTSSNLKNFTSANFAEKLPNNHETPSENLNLIFDKYDYNKNENEYNNKNNNNKVFKLFENENKIENLKKNEIKENLIYNNNNNNDNKINDFSRDDVSQNQNKNNIFNNKNREKKISDYSANLNNFANINNNNFNFDLKHNEKEILNSDNDNDNYNDNYNNNHNIESDGISYINIDNHNNNPYTDRDLINDNIYKTGNYDSFISKDQSKNSFFLLSNRKSDNIPNKSYKGNKSINQQDG
jgi:translation initiation factor 4G